MWWGKPPSIYYPIRLSISSSFMDNQIFSFLLNVPYIPFFTFLLLQNLTTSCSDNCNSLLLFHSELFFLVILNTLSRLIIIKACHSYILLRNPNLCNTSESSDYLSTPHKSYLSSSSIYTVLMTLYIKLEFKLPSL